MSGFEENNLDVLQNIEFGIVQAYKSDTSIIDLDVLQGMDALLRHYGAEQNGRQCSDPALAERPARIFASVKDICEWKLGKTQDADFAADTGEPITVTVLVECIRKIRNSVRKWNGRGGRTGYLDFVRRYVQ